MSSQAVCKVSDVDPVTKDLLERLFGQKLPAGQKLMVTLLDVQNAAGDMPRQAAWAIINRILDEAAVNMKSVADEEFEAALEEAMEHVRPRRSG